jgi:hypothetical protein
MAGILRFALNDNPLQEVDFRIPPKRSLDGAPIFFLILTYKLQVPPLRWLTLR